MSWQLPGSDGQPILGDTHLPTGTPRGVVLLCHGFKGYKDYGFFPRLGQRLADAGLIAHRFNFSHSGMTDRIETFERPDLFQLDTFGRQIFDLQAVAAAVGAGQIPGRGRPMSWFGHSRGGVTALLSAAYGEIKPDRLVVAAAPDRASNLIPDLEALLRAEGSLLSPSSRTGQNLRVGVQWLDDIQQHAEKRDPVAAIARLDIPILLLHGDADATVPVAACHRLRAAAGPKIRQIILPGASHTFDADATGRFLDAVTTFLTAG